MRDIKERFIFALCLVLAAAFLVGAQNIGSGGRYQVGGTTWIDASSNQGVIFGINGVTSCNTHVDAVCSRLQSFGGGSGYAAWISDATGAGAAKPAKIIVNGNVGASFELAGEAIFPIGGVVSGAPTGLAKGTGTINATSYYINGTVGGDATIALSCAGGEAIKTLTITLEKGITKAAAATCATP